jgi:hypothetical protein
MLAMTITEMTRDLAQMKRSLKSLVRAAGDDMGCDGTDVEAREYRLGISALEADIREARAIRNYACAECQAMPGEECRGTIYHVHASRMARSTK